MLFSGQRCAYGSAANGGRGNSSGQRGHVRAVCCARTVVSAPGGCAQTADVACDDCAASSSARPYPIPRVTRAGSLLCGDLFVYRGARSQRLPFV